jgi:hypothetical protein
MTMVATRGTRNSTPPMRVVLTNVITDFIPALLRGRG